MNCDAPARALLTFWVAGTLDPEEATAVEAHVATCAECRAAAQEARLIVEGLQALHLEAEEIVATAAGDLTDPDRAAHLRACARCRDEVETLRAVNGDLGRAPRPSSHRLWWTGLAAAAVLIVGVSLYRRTPIAPTPSVPATSAPVAAPARVRLVVPSAPLDDLARESLIVRGDRSPRAALLQDLSAALEPYRRNDFASSSARLRALRATRQEWEVAYYLGVCLIQLDQPAEALAVLDDAAARSTSADVRFYRAVARVNSGQVDEGRAELLRLCPSPTNGSARACAALAQVPPAPGR